MSAFVDDAQVEPFDLPTCYCPGKPHEHDTVTLRTEYSYGDLIELGRVVVSDLGKLDAMGERVKLLQLGVVGWNFVDAAGEPVPIDIVTLLKLKSSIAVPVMQRIDELYQASSEPLPNASSGRSQPSSPESSTALPNRAMRRAAARSTSKSSSSPAGLRTS